MNITAILTRSCNMRCSYCFEHDGAVHSEARVMDEATALRLCEFAYEENAKNGISFFGGEPLLRRDIIEKMLLRCAELGEFSFNITTNGLLIDESFIELARTHGISVALSHDGLAQDICRRTADGKGTSERLCGVLDMVNSLPGSIVMLTTTPQTIGLLADSVAWLWDAGTRSVLAVPDGRPDVWDDDSMNTLAAQYEKIAADYERRLLRGDDVRFHQFDLIIGDRVQGKNRCDSCRIGYKQPIADFDGSLYPCIQFTGIEEFRIGDIFGGFDDAKRREVFEGSRKPVESCEGCGIADRCRHRCPCANYQQTGCMNTVSPFICTHQSILIDCADRFAERLYASDGELFMRIYDKKASDLETSVQ